MPFFHAASQRNTTRRCCSRACASRPSMRPKSYLPSAGSTSSQEMGVKTVLSGMAARRGHIGFIYSRLEETLDREFRRRHPGGPARPVDAGVLGFRRRQMDRGGELRALAPARRRHRGADRRDHRRARQGAAARRLSQLLVHRARARQALDQPSRQPRALLRRPHARRRHRLLPGDRPAAPARHHGALRRPHRARSSAPARTRSTAIAATRRSSWRWSSSTA